MALKEMNSTEEPTAGGMLIQIVLSLWPMVMAQQGLTEVIGPPGFTRASMYINSVVELRFPACSRLISMLYSPLGPSGGSLGSSVLPQGIKLVGGEEFSGVEVRVQ